MRIGGAHRNKDQNDLTTLETWVATVPDDQIPGALALLAAAQSTLASRLVSVSLRPTHREEETTWLSVEQAAAKLGRSPRWLYRNAKRLPFLKRLSRKVLLVSEQGMMRWVAVQMATIDNMKNGKHDPGCPCGACTTGGVEVDSAARIRASAKGRIATHRMVLDAKVNKRVVKLLPKGRSLDDLTAEERDKLRALAEADVEADTESEQKGSVVKTTVRLPRKLWRDARVRALDEGVDLQDLVAAALKLYLKAPAVVSAARRWRLADALDLYEKAPAKPKKGSR